MIGLPPYADLLGLAMEEDGGDAPVLVMPPGDGVVGRPGYLHGGAIAGLLEVAAFAAVRRALAGAAVTIKPVTVTIDFMRGGRLTDTRARGRILRLGGRIASVEASAWQDDPAQPIGMARMTLMLRR